MNQWMSYFLQIEGAGPRSLPGIEALSGAFLRPSPCFLKGGYSTTHWINHHAMDSAVRFNNTYPLHSDANYQLDSVICPLKNWASSSIAGD